MSFSSKLFNSEQLKLLDREKYRKTITMTHARAILLEKHLCFAIYSASHAFTRAYRSLLEPLRLTYPQYLVLLVLWERDGMRVKEIGARLHLDSGTLTPLLKRLEAVGYVRRVRDADDERQVGIMLTAAGVALEEKASSIPTDVQCLSGITNEELDVLTDRITRLRADLQRAPSGLAVQQADLA